jgi:hypothetical protein
MDFKELQKQYGGKFVAFLSDDKVVTSGKTFNEVIAKLQGMKIVNKNGLSIRFIRLMMPKFGVEQHETNKKEGGSNSSSVGNSEQASGNSSTGKEAGGLGISKTFRECTQ